MTEGWKDWISLRKASSVSTRLKVKSKPPSFRACSTSAASCASSSTIKMRNFFLISLIKLQPQKLAFPCFPKYGVNTQHRYFSPGERLNQEAIQQDFSLAKTFVQFG